jgi:hypothetical protein
LFAQNGSESDYVFPGNSYRGGQANSSSKHNLNRFPYAEKHPKKTKAASVRDSPFVNTHPIAIYLLLG